MPIGKTKSIATMISNIAVVVVVCLLAFIAVMYFRNRNFTKPSRFSKVDPKLTPFSY